MKPYGSRRAIENCRTPPALPANSFPLSVDPPRPRRVLSAMIQFGSLPKKDASFQLTTVAG